MRTIYSMIAVMFAIVLSAACSKTDISQKEQTEDGPYEISIIGEMGGFDISTKSSVESVIRMKWSTTAVDANKDVVWVYGYDGSTFGSLGSLKATSSEANPYTATLSGTISAIPSDRYLYLVHCPTGTYSQPGVTTSSITFDMSATEQSATVTPFIIYSVVSLPEESNTDLSGLTAQFSFATTVVKVNVTGLGASAGLEKATISNINKNCSLNFNNGKVTVTAAPATPESTDLGTYTKKLSGSATASGKATFLLAVPAMSANTGRELYVATGGETYTDCGVFPGGNTANSYVNTICCVKELVVLLPGKFSVSGTKKIRFTKGNLRCNKEVSPVEWHIESSQTAYPTSRGTNHIGHFFWTNQTDYKSGNASYMPYAETYSYSTQSTGDKFFCGVDDPMTVDGQSGLYSLTKDEWQYLINTRTNASNLHKKGVSVTTSAGTVNNCLVIAPDDYSGEIAGTYDVDAWATAEAAGLVCLPANVNGSYGYYWLATPAQSNADCAYVLFFKDSEVSPSHNGTRNNKHSIRLVCSVSN